MSLLQHEAPEIRAGGCRCEHPSPAAIPLLAALFGELIAEPPVADADWVLVTTTQSEIVDQVCRRSRSSSADGTEWFKTFTDSFERDAAEWWREFVDSFERDRAEWFKACAAGGPAKFPISRVSTRARGRGNLQKAEGNRRETAGKPPASG